MENTDSTCIKYALNPKTITSIYPIQAPSLSGVCLHELSIICGGDLQCKLRFDLHDFPADAPPKWVQREYNTVQLVLNLTQVTIKQCVIPSGNGIGDLSIVREGTGFHIAFSTQAQGVVFRAQTTWIHVDSISAYLNGYAD